MSTYGTAAPARPMFIRSLPPRRSPIVLTNRELLHEADDLALRIARASSCEGEIHMRDVRLVQELAARLKGSQ